MPSINVDKGDKEWFDDWKGDRSHAEAFADMCAIVQAYEGEPVDHRELAEELRNTLINDVETASYRAIAEFCDEKDIRPSQSFLSD